MPLLEKKQKADKKGFTSDQLKLIKSTIAVLEDALKEDTLTMEMVKEGQKDIIDYFDSINTIYNTQSAK